MELQIDYLYFGLEHPEVVLYLVGHLDGLEEVLVILVGLQLQDDRVVGHLFLVVLPCLVGLPYLVVLRDLLYLVVRLFHLVAYFRVVVHLEGRDCLEDQPRLPIQAY